MRVLWLCNIVLPELSDIFGFKRTQVGGWLTGMWRELKKQPDLQLGICVPILNKDRMKDGIYENYKYYSFHETDEEKFLEEQTIRFCEIINDFQPQIIHIWGTEYMHSLALVNAAEKKDLLEKTIINLQGLLGICAIHYTNNLPYAIVEKCVNGKSIQDDVNDFIARSKFEKICLQKVKHVIGRTTWDKVCVKQINRQLTYHFCGEILRPIFYINAHTWKYENCEKYSIFISQANYPIKGFHIFLKGLVIIKKDFPNVKVYVAGENLLERKSSYAQYILDIIEEYELFDNIKFLGMLSAENMCEYYRKCNVFVSASVIENSPNSICEAAMIGVPIVASNVGGVSDLITHMEDGYLYPYDEYYMMAYYVCELFEASIYIYRNKIPHINRKIELINNVKRNNRFNLEIYENIIDI